MVDSSIIYNVIVNFQTNTGAKANKILETVNKNTAKTGKIFTGLNKIFQTGSIRLFSLVFMLRRMSDAIKGMLAPAAEMTGITDVWNMTLGLFFLPVMMALLPKLLEFSDWLLSAPDSVKILVGGVAILTAGLLSLVATMALVVLGLSAIGGGSAAAGLAMVSSFAPVGLAIAGLVPLLTAFAYIFTSSFSTGTKVALSLLSMFTYMALVMNGPLLKAATAILRSLGLLGTVGLGSVVALIGSVIAFVSVLFMLMDKFGSFGNAIKAWASGIVLAIAFVVQSVVNAILGGLQAAIATIQFLVQLAADAAYAAGFDKIGDQLQGAANALNKAATYKVDLMTPTAELLDKYGMNPQAVSSLGSTSAMSSLSGASSSGTTPNATVVQNNTFNVADWQAYEKKMAEQQRKMEADLKRQIASSQV